MRNFGDPGVERLRAFGKTIFAEMTELALSTGSINLGQGFPDGDPPEAVREAAIAAIQSGQNQYPPLNGVPALRSAIAEHQQRNYGLDIDPDEHVVVTAGATEAITAALIGLLEIGDEVLSFEPLYDSYRAAAAMAHAKVAPIELEVVDEHYVFDEEALRSAVGPRTKLLLLNSPHNPTGKVFDEAELKTLSEIAIEYDLIVVSDEVYEHITFDGVRHIPIASLPGMWERTISISSGGKTFRSTGWKVGWMTGPQRLLAAARRAKQFLTFVNSAPFQPAIAVGLELPGTYFDCLAQSLESGRDRLLPALTAAGFRSVQPAGGYFISANFRDIRTDLSAGEFCRMMAEQCGVVGIPSSAFCITPGIGDDSVRFAFCKTDEVLAAAAVRLAKLHA